MVLRERHSACERGAGGAQGRPAGRAPALILTYGLAVAAGYAASFTALPLPWMLGPFFCVAAASLAGLATALLPMGRELGQVAIGLAIGLRFTLPMLIATASMIPAMIAGTVYVIAFTLAAAALFRILANVDHVTAFFATAAGGVADMAHVSQRFGGSPSSVAIVHAMRVSGVVAIVPIVVVVIGEHGSSVSADIPSAGGYLSLILGLILAFAVAKALKPTPLPNPWLVGPIFAGMLIGLSGLLEIAVPPALIVAAQIMLGTWLGSQFKRSVLTQLPRVTAAAIVISLFMIACAAAGAVVLAAATGLPYSTSFLSLAPAAVTEMVLTAKLMNLDAEIVSAFHIVRIAIVSSSVLAVFRLYVRMTGGTHGPRL